jgi:hypothetical protein
MLARRGPPITTMSWGSGCNQHPGHPPSDLVLTAALLFVTAYEGAVSSI